MKYSVRIILLFLCLGMGGIFQSGKEANAGSLGTRGVWVSCFEYDDIGLAGKTEKEFRQNANTLFYNIKANGCNTVYFHVRSYDDAIYPSKVTGWSERMTKGRTLTYDPLKILISYAHKYGIKFHAWMNPYRITGKKVLNPGESETTERIVAQVKEIIRYPVDGIHFDDYFYPTNEKKYNKVTKEERMKNVNEMVKRVYQTVKSKKKTLKFGISPAGTLKYCEKIGADVKTWMSVKGYVDYIVPQIYWSDDYILQNGEKYAMFRETLAQWRALNTRDIPMYVGLAAYKAGEKDKQDKGWKKRTTNLSNQLKQIRKGNTEGYVLFQYSDLNRSGAWKEVKNVLASISTIRLKTKKKTIRAGKKYKIKVRSATPSRIQKGIRFRTSNKKIATVSAKGLVRAKRKGTVKITAYYGIKKVICKIKVKAKKISKRK